jgi:hypothetical protein
MNDQRVVTDVMATTDVPLDVLQKEITACLQRMVRDQQKADDWRTSARLKLIEAYKRTNGGTVFEKFLAPICEQVCAIQDDSGRPKQISLSYAYEIMGKTTEEMRADWRAQAHAKAERNRAARAAQNSRSPGKTSNPLKRPKKKKTQPQLLATFRKCVDAMTEESRREALDYLMRNRRGEQAA